MDLSFSSLFPIVSLLILLFLFILRYRNNARNINKLPPGRYGLPIIGEMLDFLMPGRSHRFVQDRIERYSSTVFKTSLLGHKVAVLCGPSGNKFLANNDNKAVHTWIPPHYTKLFHSAGDAPDDGMEVRQLITEFVKPEALQKYIHVMDVIVRQHLEKEWGCNEVIKVTSMAKKLAVASVLQLFMGIDDPTEMAELSEQYSMLTRGVYSIPIDFPGTTFNRAIKAAKLLRSLIQKIIQKQKLNLSAKKDSETYHLLAHLLRATDDQGRFLPEAKIERVLLVALVASTDSTSSTIASLLYYLSNHPDVYEKVLKEQIDIANSKGPGEFLTWEDTQRMKFSRNVVNEVLRMAPPASGTFKEARDDVWHEGFTIPKGWKIRVSFTSAHRDPKYFPDPDVFDPMRFDKGRPVPFTFAPFGVGPRMCPGYDFARQFILVFVHNFIRKFKWEKLDPKEKIILGVLAIHPNGLPIRIYERVDQTTTDE